MKKTLLLTAGLLCSSSLMAGDLLSVYQLAKQNDPTLQAAEQSRFAVGEIKPQSRALLLPNLSVAGDTTDNSVDTDSNFNFNPSRDEDFNTNGYTVTLVQPVFDYDLWVGLSQADSTDKQAAADYITAEQDLIIRLATRYFNVLGAQDNLEFSNAEKDANARQLEQAKQRFEVGLIAITDVHEAQARYDITVADVILAENLLANTRDALEEIIGVYNEDIKPLKEKIPLLSPEPANQEEWVTSAYQSNPTIASANFGLEIARDEVKRQRSGHFPTVDVVASHSDDSSNSAFGFERESDAISLQLNLPIYQGGFVNSRTREAAYRHNEAKQLLEQSRRAVARQTRDAYLGVISSISRVKAFNAAVISNTKALEATEAGFEVGTRTIVDVLLSTSQLYLAERDYARSRYDYILNTLSLKQAAGTLNEQDIAFINEWILEK